MESSIRGMSFEEERGDREVNQNEAEGSATVADTATGGGGDPETTLRTADALLRFELFKL